MNVPKKATIPNSITNVKMPQIYIHRYLTNEINVVKYTTLYEWQIRVTWRSLSSYWNMGGLPFAFSRLQSFLVSKITIQNYFTECPMGKFYSSW